jgi:PAS domain S-box-containing protein
MTGSNIACEKQAKRCAVCKIDLKGRFVYVDDATEQLTGYTKEELFGKSFLNLVTEAGHPLVTHVLYHRNHYETFFDSVRLEIIDRNKNPRSATVIFSLNFIAGNPVNFQVIIDVDTSEEVDAANSSVDYALRDFIHELLVLSQERYCSEVPTILSEYLCRSRPTIYAYRRSQGELELLSAATSSNAAGQPAADSTEPKALLTHTAETGEEYCCDESGCIQHAIERIGFAPHEFIARVRPDTKHTYVVRLPFDERADAGDLQRRVSEARQAIQLIERLGSTAQGDRGNETEPRSNRDSDRKAQGRGTLQEAQLALTSAMQLLNRLDKYLRE